MKVKLLEREFVFDKIKLADPSPDMDVHEVKDFYSAEYPELINAIIDGPKISASKEVYTFKNNIGTKG